MEVEMTEPTDYKEYEDYVEPVEGLTMVPNSLF